MVGGRGLLRRLRDALSLRTIVEVDVPLETGDLLVVVGDEVQVLSVDGVPDGWVLTRDSGAPTGLAWVAP